MPVDRFSNAFQSREWWMDAFPWLREEIVTGISWWNILACLIVLLLAAVIQLFVNWVVRCKLRRDAFSKPGEPQHEHDARRWHDLLLRATLIPFGALVWVYGVYWSFSFLFLSWRRLKQPPPILGFFDWIKELAFFIIIVWLLYRMIDAMDGRLRHRASKRGSEWDKILSPLIGRTLRVILPLVAIIMGLPLVPLSPDYRTLVRIGVSLLVVVCVTGILFQIISALEEGVRMNFRMDVADNLKARKLHTQVTMLKKVAMVVIGIIAFGSVLMIFEPLRRFGTSILASAGIAGIIIGFAAQRSLGTLLAGFQIAITQPIRLDDVVIVEKEWGRIEEITLTYVVVRIWDLRRMVLPIDYFIRKPFENWTRRSADILGSVILHVDYTVPVAALRAELDRILEKTTLWDRKVRVLQVTEAQERALQLRILVSAVDAGTAWDLRCEVRERMIEFIRHEYPDALPRVRTAAPSADVPGFLPRRGE